MGVEAETDRFDGDHTLCRMGLGLRSLGPGDQRDGYWVATYVDVD